MNTWQSVKLGNRIESAQSIKQIQEAFSPISAAAGCPFDMAIFTLYDEDEDTDIAYFSPSAYELSRIFKATPCKKPPRSGLCLLIGDDRCWEILFPGESR